MDLNRATILGRLTRDPEVKATPSGQSVANFSVATNMVWTDKNGVKQEKPEFHNIVLWGKLADIAGQYLGKGRRVYVEGRLETSNWTGEDGVKRYRTEIIASNLIMLDGRSAGSSNASAPHHDDNSQSMDDNPPPQSAVEDEIKVEDIPF